MRKEPPADVCVVVNPLRLANYVTPFLRALRRAGSIVLRACVVLTCVVFLSAMLLGLDAWHHIFIDRKNLPDLGPFTRFEFPTIGHVYDINGESALPVFQEVMLKAYRDGLVGPEPAFPDRMEQRITHYLEGDAATIDSADR